jgi:hypothetical protein
VPSQWIAPSPIRSTKVAGTSGYTNYILGAIRPTAFWATCRATGYGGAKWFMAPRYQMIGAKWGSRPWPYWAAALIGAEGAMVLANAHDGVPTIRLSQIDWAGIPLGTLTGEGLAGALIGLLAAFTWNRLVRKGPTFPPPTP